MAYVKFHDAIGTGAFVRAGNFTVTNGDGSDFVIDTMWYELFDDDTLEFYGAANGGAVYYSIFVDYIGDPNVFLFDAVILLDSTTLAPLVEMIGLDVLFDIRDDFSAGVQYTNLYAGNDEFYGNRFADYIESGLGNDLIVGNRGADILLGQGGNDTLNGGPGKDLLLGGENADRFVFRTVLETANSTTGCDVIADFVTGTDRIDLSRIDAFAPTAANEGFVFRGTGAFSIVSAGEVRFARFDQSGTANDFTMIYIDTDADAASEAMIRVNGLHTFTATSFLL